METETPPTRKRRNRPLELQPESLQRSESSQKCKTPHGIERRSPITPKKRYDKGSAIGKGGSVSTRKRDSSFAERASIVVAENPFEILDYYGDVSSRRPLQGSDATSKKSDSQKHIKDEDPSEPSSDFEDGVRGVAKVIEDIEAEEAQEAMNSRPTLSTKWEKADREKRADSYNLPLPSPFMLPSKAARSTEADLDHLPPTTSSASPSESIDEIARTVARIRERQKRVEENHSKQPHPKERDSDHDSQLQTPDSGDTLCDDSRAIIKDSGLWSPSNIQKGDQYPLPHFPEIDHNINKTSDRMDEAVSDMGQEADKSEISSQTPRSSHSKERDTLISQTQPSELDCIFVDTNPTHNPVEGLGGPEINKTRISPDTTYSSGTMEKISPGSQPKSLSPGSDQIKSPDPQTQPPGPGGFTVGTSPNQDQIEEEFAPEANEPKASANTTSSPDTLEYIGLDSQPKSPGSDQINSSDSQPQSPGPAGVTVGASPTLDEAEEPFDAQAWLNSDSPLPGNYRAIFGDEFQDLGSTSPNLSRNSNSGADSLVVSPTRTDEQEIFEERTPGAALASSNAMKIFEEYAAKFPLKRFSKEREAKDERSAKAATNREDGISRSNGSKCSSISNTHTSSEDSLLVSPDRDDDERHVNSEALRGDFDKAKEEEDSKAALAIFELHRVNFQMQKDFEEKEVKFKRDIQKAWEHTRPALIARGADRLALEKIQSKKIFDEIGEQQRPVRTDPRMVRLETNVNTMISRARLNYILGDYSAMYTHANHAAATAGRLKFAPLMARCCYYRGLASYHYRAFSMAKDDFLDSRGCAGLYGISSEDIEYYIAKIDQANDPETVTIEPFRARGFRGVDKTGRNENQTSPSVADDASTLAGDSSTSPEDIALPVSPFSSPNETERSAGPPREDASSQVQPFRKLDPLGGLPLDGDAEPKFDHVPNYKPQEEAISEEIRKDIFESKAQSLIPVSEAVPKEANPEETRTLSPPSMASTEWTLLGSATSQGTARRVPRPRIPPITTSFAKTPVREASPETSSLSSSTDEMDEGGSLAAFGRARDDAVPNTGFSDEMDEEEILREFGWAKGRVGAQGDDFTPVEDPRRGWHRHRHHERVFIDSA